MNLLEGTTDLSGSTIKTYITNEEYQGCKVAHFKSTETTGSKDILNWRMEKVEPNTFYTLSFWVKGKGILRSYLYSGTTDTIKSGYNSQGNKAGTFDGDSRLDLTNEWKREWVTWQTEDVVEGSRSLLPCRLINEEGSEVWIAGVKLEKGEIATPYSPYNCGNVNFKITNNADKEQSISFPTKEGQVFHKGDYLADDGVHHKRNTKEFVGTENWVKSSFEGRFLLPFDSNSKEITVTGVEILCTHYKRTDHINKEGIFLNNANLNSKFKYLGITTDNRFTTLEDFKANLVEQKANGTPVKIEYELEEEIIEPYSLEQQEAYDKIKELTSYKNVTHIFSEDEIKPSFEVTYYKDLETLLNNKTVSVSNEVQQEVHSEMTNEEPSMEDSVVGGEE